MNIDLSEFVDIKENEYTITNAIYNREKNELKLTIESDLDHFDEKVRVELDNYLSFVTLTIEFIKLTPDIEEDFCGNEIESDINEVEIIEDKDLEKKPREIVETNQENCEEDPCDQLRDKKEKDLQARISHAINLSHSKEEKKQIEPLDGLDFGSKIKNEPIPIAEIYDKKGLQVSLIGTVYNLDVFETKNHYFIYTFDLEDNTCLLYTSDAADE